MTTLRENIVAQVVTRLEAIPGGPPVFRSRAAAVNRADSPVLLVEPIDDIASYSQTEFVDWNLTVRVALIVRADEPDKVADPLIAALHAALMADRTLGDRCFDILPSRITFDKEAADMTAGIISCLFSVSYRTDAASQEN